MFTLTPIEKLYVRVRRRQTGNDACSWAQELPNHCTFGVSFVCNVCLQCFTYSTVGPVISHWVALILYFPEEMYFV